MMTHIISHIFCISTCQNHQNRAILQTYVPEIEDFGLQWKNGNWTKNFKKTFFFRPLELISKGSHSLNYIVIILACAFDISAQFLKRLELRSYFFLEKMSHELDSVITYVHRDYMYVYHIRLRVKLQLIFVFDIFNLQDILECQNTKLN